MYIRGSTTSSAVVLLWAFLPGAHAFAGVIGVLRYVRPTSENERLRVSEAIPRGRPIVDGFHIEGGTGRKRRRGALMGTEEVEDFEIDMEIDTGKLDIFGTIITQVKMEGRVPASTHLVYDCSHGEWLLAQMAYDRKIRVFCSRSVKQLGNIATVLPENSRFIFSGALIPKQVKRLVKTKGLSAIVAKDVEGIMALSEAMNEERDRLAAKGLSRVSQSRERFLLERGGGNVNGSREGPTRTIADELGVFVRIEEGQKASEVAETIRTVEQSCDTLSVTGLWGGSLMEDMCLKLLEEVREKSRMPKLRVALDHKGPSSADWFKRLQSTRRGPVMWTFDYEM